MQVLVNQWLLCAHWDDMSCCQSRCDSPYEFEASYTMRGRIAATQHPLEPDLILPRRRTSKVSQPTGRKVGGQRVATVAANLKMCGGCLKSRATCSNSRALPSLLLFLTYVMQQTWRQATPNCSGWEGRLSGAGRGGAPRHSLKEFGGRLDRNPVCKNR